VSDFREHVTGALWLTRTTEQPAVMVTHPRPLEVFDQMLSGPPYTKPPKPAWHPVMHQLIGLVVGLGLAAGVVFR
jgi:hypothetical protein